MSHGEGWTGTTLGAVVEPLTSRAVPEPNTHLPYIGMEHVRSGTGEVVGSGDARAIRSSSPTVLSGDVLYGRLRPYLNKVAVSPSDAYVSGEFIVFRENAKIAARFLKWRLSAPDFVDFAVSLNSGDRPRVKWAQMRGFGISLPPRSEQLRIVEILEDQLSRVEAATSSLTSMPKRLEAMLASAVREEFARLDGCERVAVGDLVEPGRKIAYGVLVPGADLADGVPMVRVGDLTTLAGPAGLKRIAPDIDARFPRTRLHGGEVLLSVVGTIGRVAVAPHSLSGANVARAVAVLPLGEHVEPEFVAYALQDRPTQRWLAGVAHEVARKTLNLEDVRRLRLPVPPIEVQSSLARRLKSTHASAHSLELATKQVERRTEALRRAVLSAAFKGNLTGRHTDQEVIEELAGV